MTWRRGRSRLESFWRALPWVALAVSAGACGGGEPVARVPRRSLLSAAVDPTSYPMPARWRYHPPEEAALNARLDLGTSVLFAGARGERWLVDKGAGRARAAASLAPEDLIAILRRERAWLFIGKTGTSYEAREPLGAFVRSSAPFEPLVSVSARSSTLLGVRRAGNLVRSVDGGASWQATGPRAVEFVDVAQGKPGESLAIAVPEQIWHSADEGATWKKLETESFGAFELGLDRAGELVARGPLGARRLAGASFVPAEGAASNAHWSLGAVPPRGPDAGALREGRAAVVGGRYFELVRDSKAGQAWKLLEGPVDGELGVRSLVAARGCELLRLAGFERWLYFACSRRSPTSLTQPVEIFRSQDAGRSFKREPYSVEARLAQLVMAVGSDGSLIVSGICALRDNPSGCKPYGVHYRRPSPPRLASFRKSSAAASAPSADKPAFELSLAATPALREPALALAFSTDGRAAYAVGRRTKNNALAVFVSRDAGKSFTGHDIDVAVAETDDEPDEERLSLRPSSSVQDLEGVSAGDDGTLSIVLRRYGTPTLVVTDDEGRVLSRSNPPADTMTLGASGARALAISTHGRQIWESLDAGVTWKGVGRLPLDPCPGDERCSLPTACHPGGCVIGDELSRIGWRGQQDEAATLLARPTKLSSNLLERKLGVPLSCSLAEARWTRLPSVSNAPTAEQAAIGNVAWFATAADFERAAASVFHATGGTRPRVEAVGLIAPAARPEQQALSVARQVEGVAALRYVIPEATAGETHLLRAEVAWDNLLEGRVARVRLPDGGEYSPGDYERAGSGAQRAAPALLSIASSGVYLRIHKLAGDQQPTLFLDGQRVSKVSGLRWPKPAGKVWRAEMVHVGDAHVPLLLAEDGSGVIRARSLGERWLFDAYATGPFEPAAFELDAEADLAYVGGRSGLQVTTFDRAGTRQSGKVFVFRSAGAVTEPPVAIPLQRDVPDQPKACSAVQRADSPRVVVPFQSGTRHPIVVTDSAEPMRVLLTDRAVMHGTPSEPCVAAYDAESVALDGTTVSERERAIIPVDDLSHAWLFRVRAESTAIEYRLMSCRFDSGAEVPPAVYRAPGTTSSPGSD